MTFADIEALLMRALAFTTNPAILRLPEADRTVEGLARAYHTRRVFWLRSDGVIDETCHVNTVSALRGWSVLPSTELDLTDAGTVGAVKTALGLALGLDPAEAATGLTWIPFWADTSQGGWFLGTDRAAWYFVKSENWTGDTDEIIANDVAEEMGGVKALALAVRRVLGVA